MTQLKSPQASKPSSRSSSVTDPVDILILGAGWSSTFLLPLLEKRKIPHAATTRTGHGNTIPFTYNPESKDAAPYSRLPPARTVLITFPLKGHSQSTSLTSLYEQTHNNTTRWIQLGSTGIFTEKNWNDSNSDYDKSNARAIAEDELLDTLKARACVLNLAGLYGGERQPRNWVTRVAKTKEDVKGKAAVHLVHGRDVGNAVINAHLAFDKVGGKRWIITDLHVYDWWDLIQCWGKYARENDAPPVKMASDKGAVEGVENRDELQYERWVVELMAEEGVRALPRDKGDLGRVLDGRGFWQAVGGAPEEGRVS